jgi:hypothetical protein
MHHCIRIHQPSLAQLTFPAPSNSDDYWVLCLLSSGRVWSDSWSWTRENRPSRRLFRRAMLGSNLRLSSHRASQTWQCKRQVLCFAEGSTWESMRSESVCIKCQFTNHSLR